LVDHRNLLGGGHGRALQLRRRPYNGLGPAPGGTARTREVASEGQLWLGVGLAEEELDGVPDGDGLLLGLWLGVGLALWLGVALGEAEEPGALVELLP
jgi:hypothetical protein